MRIVILRVTLYKFPLAEHLFPLALMFPFACYTRLFQVPGECALR